MPEDGFCWDGYDRFGRRITGSVSAYVSVGYVYQATYGATDAFGYNGGGRISIAAGPFAARFLRPPLVLWSHVEAIFEQWDARAEGLGGWTLPMQHRWDVEGQRVLLGHGGAFPVHELTGSGWAQRVAGIEVVSGSSAPVTPSVDDGTLALNAGLPPYGWMQFDPLAVAIDGRGQVHVALADGRVMRIDGEGRLRLVVDTVIDRWLPTQTSRGTPSALAIAGDGTIYIAFLENRVWRYRGGVLDSFAGDGTDGGTAMPPPITGSSSPVRAPSALAVDADGAVYIAERSRGLIRRVLPSGVMTVFAGNGLQPGGILSDGCQWVGGGAAPNDVPAIDTWLCLPSALAVGPDGSVYIAGSFNVSRVLPDGRLRHTAGQTHSSFTCNNLPPSDGDPGDTACLYRPASLATLPGGYLAVGMTSEGGQNAVFSIDPGGRIWRIAGGNTPVVPSAGAVRRPLLHPWLHGANGLAVDPRGRLHVLSTGTRTVWRLDGNAPDRVPGGNIVIDSPDGSERYTFARDGRHLATHDGLTGVLRQQFVYDGARLTSVTDGFGNAITISYPGGDSFVITGPHGATATGTLNGAQRLTHVDAGEWGSTDLVYGASDGGLRAMRDVRGRWHRYQYAEDGHFSHDSWAASATADVAGGRVVSLHPSAVTETGSEVSWSVTTRDGTSLTSGLDTTHAVLQRADGTERRTTTPSVGPEEVTDTGSAMATIRPAGLPTSYERVGFSTRSGANGLAWARSMEAPLSMTMTPFDGYTRTDTRAGALRLATVATRTVVPDNATTLAAVDRITVQTAVVAPVASDSTIPDFGHTVWPLGHAGYALRWITTTERDGANWQVTTESPRGRTTVARLDSFGRVQSVQTPPITQPDGTVPVYPVLTTYDGRGRVSTVTQGTRRVTWTYDDNSSTPAAVRGRVAHITASLTTGGPTRVTSFAYNQDGARTVRTTAPGGAELRTALDEAGNTVSITPPGRTAHTFAYGWRDRPERYTPPVPAGGGAASDWETTYEHEVQGMPHQVASPDGTYAFTYSSGRLSAVSLTAPGGGVLSTRSFSYDEATGGGAGTGVLTRVTHSSNGVLEYGHEFTATGTLPTSETWRITEGTVETARSVSVGYDSFGRVASWTATGGPTIAVGYEADGLVSSMGELSIARDPSAGAELGTAIGASGATVETTQRYGAYGEVVSRGSTYGGETGLSFAYGYDGFGRLTHVTESGEGSDGERWYRYDAAGRLAQVCSSEDCGEGADGGAGDLLESYSYGANGTRTAWTNGAGSASVATEDVDAQDRLLHYTRGDGGEVTYTYDHVGRLSTRVARAADSVVEHTTTLTYDADGALTSFTRTGAGAAAVTYRNDATGRRIARVVGGAVTARWTYHGIHPVAEYDADWVLKRVYVYATRGHVPDYVAQSDGSGGWALYRVVTDHLGSVRRVVRVSDSAVMQRMRYDAYGRVLQDEAASGWERVPFGYAGGIYDRATGLVRFGARDYDAEIGRWTAKDPIGFEGGDGSLYGYCSNIPTDRIDPSGHVLIVPIVVFVLYAATFTTAFVVGYAYGSAYGTGRRQREVAERGTYGPSGSQQGTERVIRHYMEGARGDHVMALEHLIRDRELSDDPNFYNDPDVVNTDHYLQAADLSRLAGYVGGNYLNAHYAAVKLRGPVASSGSHLPSPASADADRWAFRGTSDQACGRIIGSQ